MEALAQRVLDMVPGALMARATEGPDRLVTVQVVALPRVEAITITINVTPRGRRFRDGIEMDWRRFKRLSRRRHASRP